MDNFSQKYILWDLDGTIVESENSDFKREMFASASKKIGLHFDLQPQEFIGHEARNIFARMLEKNNIKNTDDYFSHYESWYENAVDFIKKNVQEIKPRENVIEIWQQCFSAKIKQAVVTSSRSDVAQAYLQNIGLFSLCETLVCVDDVVQAKPSPLPYLTAVKNLQANVASCIAIEDSASGIHSATEAGIFTVAWVTDTENPQFTKANVITSKIDFNMIKGFLYREGER